MGFRSLTMISSVFGGRLRHGNSCNGGNREVALVPSLSGTASELIGRMMKRASIFELLEGYKA